jgi:hypothetical protein
MKVRTGTVSIQRKVSRVSPETDAMSGMELIPTPIVVSREMRLEDYAVYVGRID